MSSSVFQKYFLFRQRPTKLQRKSDVKAASGNQLVSEGIYPIPFTIDRRQFEHNVHVFSNLNEGMILGIDFLTKYGLGLDPSSSALYWTDKSTANWHQAKLQCPEKITINPISNKIVTLNVLTNCGGFRVAEAGEAVAVISSPDYVVQGGPALVRINRLGQATMEIFNCTNSVMTIEKDSFLGIIERIKENDTVRELNVNEMTVNIEQAALPTPTKITEEKKKYILDNAKLNVPEEFRQRYIDLLLKHHEVTSSRKYDLGKCTTSMHDQSHRTSSPYPKPTRIAIF
jgi:hypothetical protein